MKQFKDLKIGDTAFLQHSVAIEEVKVTSIGGDYAVTVSGYRNRTKVREFSAIADCTFAIMDDTYTTIYLNKFEAIDAVKESYRKQIDAKAKEIETKIAELIQLKEEIYKYL